MANPKIRTYADKLLENKDFSASFQLEYENLVISEKIAELRHRAHLTQDQLAKRIHTKKVPYERKRF